MNAEHAGKPDVAWRHTGASAPPPLSPIDAVFPQTPAMWRADLGQTSKDRQVDIELDGTEQRQ